MKQRLGLAAALLQPRELLILDEPTNGLDPQGTREVRKLVRELATDGTTVLVSSHLLSEIEQVATHVGMMSGGRLVRQGTLDRGARRRRADGARDDARPRARGRRCCTVSGLTPDGRRGRRRASPPGSATRAVEDVARGARRGRRAAARAHRRAARSRGPVRVDHRRGLRCPPLSSAPRASPTRYRGAFLRQYRARDAAAADAGAATRSCSPCWPSSRSSSASPSRSARRAAATVRSSSAASPATGCSWCSPRSPCRSRSSCRWSSASSPATRSPARPGSGTLRYLLTVPVGRGRLLAVKTLAVATFTALAVLVVAVVGLVTGGDAVRPALAGAAVR